MRAPLRSWERQRIYAALFRPHSRAEAISAPSRIDLSLSQTDRLDHPFAAREGTETAIGRGDDALAVADRRYRLFDPPRHHFRVLDEIAGRLHDAGDEDHVLGERHALQRRVFVRVPRIGELDRQRADFGLIERRQNLFERDIVDVRPFPIAVTDMQPHAVGRNALDAFVDHRHMQFARLDEVGIGGVAIEHGAVHGEVGRIDLQHEACFVDRLILVAHLARDRGEISFVGIVEGVEHGGGDDAGRGRRHERLGKRLAFAGDALVERNLALDCRRIAIVDLALRLRGVLLPAHIRKAARQIADELGKFLEFASAPPFRFAAEA